MSNKKMIIKGVGTMMAKRICPNGRPELITLGTLQDLRIDMSVDIDEIFGGDGLFAIDTLVTGKSIEISATDASFDLNAVSLMMGTELGTGETAIWVLNELGTVEEINDGGDTVYGVKVKYGQTALGSGDTVESMIGEDFSKDISVRFAESNILLSGDFDIEEIGDKKYITGFSSKSKGKDVYVSYRRKVENATWTDILSDQVPFPVHVIHHGSFQQKDGTFQGIETELYTCQAKGTFSIDAQRASASASTIELQVIQPYLGKRLGTIKRFQDTIVGNTCGVLSQEG